MSLRGQVAALVKRECAELEEAAPTSDASESTPQQKLLRAAQGGQFEALVGKARPAEPVAMVTPQERETELRASGQWSTEKPESKPAPKPEPDEEPTPESPPSAPEGEYVAQHCYWRPRGWFDESDSRPAGGLISDYDVLAEFDED